jgi:hypothetical protein
MMRAAIATVLAGGLSMLLACAPDSGGDSPFDSPTGAAPGGASASASAADEEDEDDVSGTGASSSDGDAAASTGSDVDPADADTSGPASTGAQADPPDAGSGTDGGVPPATGMYGECLVPEDCAAPNNVCIVVNDTEGFCTNMACTNPATDCDPAPGGTATPICFPIELNGMPTASCALGCAGGLTCPVGMTCWPLAEGSICA